MQVVLTMERASLLLVDDLHSNAAPLMVAMRVSSLLFNVEVKVKEGVCEFISTRHSCITANAALSFLVSWFNVNQWVPVVASRRGGDQPVPLSFDFASSAPLLQAAHRSAGADISLRTSLTAGTDSSCTKTTQFHVRLSDAANIVCIDLSYRLFEILSSTVTPRSAAA